jgi:hypothetical protein
VRDQNTLGYFSWVDPGRLTLGDQNGGIPGITRPKNPRGPAYQVFTEKKTHAIPVGGHISYSSVLTMAR